MGRLTTGKLAREARVNLETIRYYERQGLLAAPPRTQAGYRVYTPDTVRRVRFIKRAQELGFSLKEITELLALRVDARTTCAGVRRRAKAKLTDVKAKLRSLQEISKALVRLTAACTGRGPASECPILDYLEAEETL